MNNTDALGALKDMMQYASLNKSDKDAKEPSIIVKSKDDSVSVKIAGSDIDILHMSVAFMDGVMEAMNKSGGPLFALALAAVLTKRISEITHNIANDKEGDDEE